MDIFEHVKQVVKYDNLDKSCLVGGKNISAGVTQLVRVQVYSKSNLII